MSECCLRGFQWEATPEGHETKLAGNDCYVTGTNSAAGIMLIHDLYGWKFTNIRLLADHYAKEVGATVYVPDFFGGEVLPADILSQPPPWPQLDIEGFIARNSKDARTPEIVECAQEMRARHRRTGAIGFCFGGWAVFRLGARERGGLVDCISAAHPTHLTREEIEQVAVPVQIIAPEIDPQFTDEMKEFSNKVIPTLGVPYDYQFFPGLVHSFATRGDPNDPAERKGMERAKNTAVFWFRQWLHVD